MISWNEKKCQIIQKIAVEYCSYVATQAYYGVKSIVILESSVAKNILK